MTGLPKVWLDRGLFSIPAILMFVGMLLMSETLYLYFPVEIVVGLFVAFVVLLSAQWFDLRKRSKLDIFCKWMLFFYFAVLAIGLLNLVFFLIYNRI